MKRVVVLWLILLAVSAVRMGMLLDRPTDAVAAELPDPTERVETRSGPRPIAPSPASPSRFRPTALVADTSASPVRSIELALAELARLLETPVLGRTRWELAARGLSTSLGAGAGPPLHAIVSDRKRPSTELVAAAELLRRLPAPPEVPAQAIARLRQVAFGGVPDSAPASAARRILAQLGDWSDRLNLVRELSEPLTPETRIAAAWSLQAAASPDVLLDLTDVLRAHPDARAAELAVLAIESILRRARPIPEHVRATLTETVLAALDDPNVAPVLPSRAASLLGALGGHAAHEALARMADGGPARGAAARALSRDEQGRRRLVEMVASAELGSSERLAAACALVRGPETADAELGIAVDGLRCVIETGQNAEDRRRAVLALADCATDASRLALEQALLDDEDAGVRAAAVIAMARFEDKERFTNALESCAQSDSSEGVRELAIRVLE